MSYIKETQNLRNSNKSLIKISPPELQMELSVGKKEKFYPSKVKQVIKQVG